MMVDIAALAMAIIQGWGWTFFAAWIATILYSTQLREASPAAAQFFMLAFFILFYIPSALSACGILKKKWPLRGGFILLTAVLMLSAWVEAIVNPDLKIWWYCFGILISFAFAYVFTRNWNILDNARPNLNIALAWIIGFAVMYFAFHATWPKEVSFSDWNLLADLNICLYFLIGDCIIYCPLYP